MIAARREVSANRPTSTPPLEGGHVRATHSRPMAIIASASPAELKSADDLSEHRVFRKSRGIMIFRR